MKDFAAQSLKTVIKDLLKKRKMRYEELAVELDCSVPTVKRILGPEELTLTRLLEICEVLDLSLSELETLANKSEPAKVEYNQDQSTFLARNPSHFAYLMKLYEGHTPKQIAQEYGLNARSTDKYLVALEKYELIRVTGAQKVKPAYKQVPTFGRGELAQRYYKSFIQNGAEFFKRRVAESLAAAEKATADTPNEPASFVLHSAKVSRKTYEEWGREQVRQFDEFSRLASFEQKTLPESELMTVVAIEARTLVPNDHSGLRSLEEAMYIGKIEAI